MFSLLSVYEAAILSWAAQNNLPLEIVKRAFLWRKRQLLPGPGGWVEEEFRPAVEQGHFREFGKRSDDDPAFWVIGISKGYWAPDLEHDEIELDPNDFLGVMAGPESGIEEAASRFRGRNTVLINITQIVNSVDRALEAAGWKSA